MLRRSVFTAIALVSLMPALCVAGVGEWVTNKATRSLQLTESGRGTHGQFSPDGRSVAFLELVKHFTPEGKHYFRARVHLWDGVTDRVLAELPSADPVARLRDPDHYVHDVVLRWLPSGGYIWASPHLIRVADGATTKAGKEGRWFVLNSAWPLGRWDGIALNSLVRKRGSQRFPESYGARMADSQIPPAVARESANWRHLEFRRSPADRNLALYLGYDKHFAGCGCCAGGQRTYLGIAHLDTGRLQRVTYGRLHHVPAWSTQWSPDGKWISYHRDGLSSGEGAATWHDLYIARADGSGDRRLVAGCADCPYDWLSPRMMLVPVGRDTAWREPLAAVQLALVSVPGGQRMIITEGPYRHEVCDTHGERVLVCERELASEWSRGNLHVIEPL